MVVHKLAPQPGEYSYVFGGREPMISIKPGDIAEVSTEDCFGGRVTSPDQLPSEAVPFNEMNPVSGPIQVEGAEPGDMLAVHFVSIVPARKYAVSCVLPQFGALTGTRETAMLNESLEERVWFYDIDLESWTASFKARNSDFRLQLPLDPMHGTVGVAPAGGEVRLVMTPSTHGGNMDTPEARARYHAVPAGQCGGGHALPRRRPRTPGRGRSLRHRPGIRHELGDRGGPDQGGRRILAPPGDDDYIMSTGSTRPLEDAYRISQKDLIAWTSDLTGMDMLDSYQLVSQMGLAPAANVCDPNYTMVARLPKWTLQGAQAYGGAHSRLRKAAEDYTSR